jgi:hypothetical protein
MTGSGSSASLIDDLYLVVRENALDIIQLLVAHGSDTDARKEAPLNNIVLRSLLMNAIYPIRFHNDPHTLQFVFRIRKSGIGSRK